MITKAIGRGGWILKSEPNEFSIYQLAEKKTNRWDGIRNYQARNYIRDMKIGEKAFFYHSSCSSPGIYGLMSIIGDPYPDPLSLDPKSEYFDKKATVEKNPWTSIDVRFEAEYKKPLLLNNIKDLPLGPCPLTARGNRLSVIPITEEQVNILLAELERTNNTTISDSDLQNPPATSFTQEKKKRSKKRPIEETNNQFDQFANHEEL